LSKSTGQRLDTQKTFTIIKPKKENTMPNYLISIVGMTAILIVSSVVCGFLMYKNEQDEKTN
jgi:hypothetical protein